MRPARRTILFSFELIAISLVASHPLRSQSAKPDELRRSWYTPADCEQSVSYFTKARDDVRATGAFLRSELGANRSGCVSPEPGENSRQPEATSNVENALTAPRPVVRSKPEPPKLPASEPALRDIGEAGTKISRAREAILEILKDNNACSEWFRRSDPQVDTTFSTLVIAVDENGAKHVIKEHHDDGGWIEHGPYIARTWQEAGRGATITINGNGAFFRTKGDLYKIEWRGGMEIYTGTWRHLNVGPFDGASLQAQVIALLHELAHVIGAVPSDDSSVVGFVRSQENTNLILNYCKAQANAAGKRQKLLSAQR
jgi:hypothetical protein